MTTTPARAAPPASDEAARALPAQPLRLEFDYVDKICLAGTCREFGTSSAPVWQLVVRGRFDAEVMRRALAAAVRQYPVVVSRAVSLQPGRPLDGASRVAYEIDPNPDLDLLFRALDLRDDPASIERVRQEIFNTYLDLATEYPVRITWARTGAEDGVLFVQQHHGIADGSAFFGFMRDLCRWYDAALAGEFPSHIAPLLKLPEDAVAEPDPGRRRWYRYLGFLRHFVDLVRALAHPIDLLASNVPDDFTGDNRVEHLLLDDSLVDRARALRSRCDLSLNDLLAGALAFALARWTREHGLPLRRFNLLLPADTRPRGAPVPSFANHLFSYVVDFDLRRVCDSVGLARAVHEQVGRQWRGRFPLKKLLVETMVVRWVSIGTMRRLIFGAKRAVLNLPFSNLIPISPPEGRFRTAAWTGEALRIMTPCLYRQGVNTTVIRYAGKLCFNFNYKASAVPLEDVRRLVEHFRTALDELLASLEGAPKKDAS